MSALGFGGFGWCFGFCVAAWRVFVFDAGAAFGAAGGSVEFGAVAWFGAAGVAAAFSAPSFHERSFSYALRFSIFVPLFPVFCSCSLLFFCFCSFNLLFSLAQRADFVLVICCSCSYSALFKGSFLGAFALAYHV